MRRCARLGLASGPAVRRLATDAHAKGKKELVPIVPVWQTTSAFKTLSDLPSRDVLKAELLQMAEQKNGFLFGEVVRLGPRAPPARIALDCLRILQPPPAQN